jgi:hypothetical protein
MNCANHADASAVAYCRTCGKALCANCTRPVKGVIYCEECLGARMEGTTPPVSAGFVAGTVPPPSAPAVPAPSSGPNPAVAGILAGFFPFGVGAVYTGQYAKGLAHLVVFALLVAGCSVSNSEVLPPICGIGIAFFIVYQIIDAVRTARALQAGLPVPDPYGLGATFGAGSKIDTSKVPFGALVLILLGVLFLLNSLGLEMGLDRFWPLILIAIGGWLFARNWGLTGAYADRCQCARCRAARLMGPAVLFTLGFLFLFESLGRIGFGRTWPILLLVIGGVKLYQSAAPSEGHVALPPAPPPPQQPNAPVPPAPPAAPSEVNRG